MNLPCKVVEDLLPLYFDCLCSEESATLVETHLKTCPSCSRVLTQLQEEIELSNKPVDDIKPLKALEKNWRKNKRANIGKGICITLAALLSVILVVFGSWYFSYGRTLFAMAESMEQIPPEDRVATNADYARSVNGCRCELWLPSALGKDGYARVDAGDGLGLLIYPESGGEYSWKLYITDQDGRMRMVYLQADMSPDFTHYDTLLNASKEKELVRQLVAQRQEDIWGMMEATKVLWGIDLVQYIG